MAKQGINCRRHLPTHPVGRVGRLDDLVACLGRFSPELGSKIPDFHTPHPIDPKGDLVNLLSHQETRWEWDAFSSVGGCTVFCAAFPFVPYAFATIY